MTNMSTSPDAAAAGAAAPAAALPARKKDGALRRGKVTRPENEGAKVNAARSQPAKSTKVQVVLKLLGAAKGATLLQIEAATGWQPHSVRGFLSGTVRKKRGLQLTSEIGKDGKRRYRIVDGRGAEA